MYTPELEELLKPLKCSAHNLKRHLTNNGIAFVSNNGLGYGDKKSMKKLDKIIKEINKLEHLLERTK